MATASTMIIRALQMLGEKEVGGSLSASEQTTYLDVLNAAMESWGLEPLTSFAVKEDSKALVAGTASYTIGSGATWNTTRPLKIIGAFIRDSSSYDSPVNVLDEEAFRLLRVKSTGNTYPTDLYYDAAYTTAYGTITVYPKPSASLTLHIRSPLQIGTFALISTTLVLPPGYQRMIESNLAVELAAGFTKVSPEVLKIARESKAAVQRLNTPARHLRLDPGVLQTYRGSNILTGP